MSDWKQGIRDGIPIALGYISVSFTFGLMAVDAGLAWWQAVLISVCNLTSAGQFMGLDIMAAGGTYLEMALAQFIINLRYALMSISLSQKVDSHFQGVSRLGLGFFMTDEIFGVAASRKGEVSRSYFLGLSTLPLLGWTLGTLAGALLGGVLPPILQSAMGIAIYGMFLAIIIPKARDDAQYLRVIVIAVILSCCFRYLPVLDKVSSGFAIIICAVMASVIGAIFYPVVEEEVSA
ncbi:MAG: AzlC family ABC transporter permease [Lachnospiraceae bacterium]|nr:AzlC family ABC transporter permease [Lachnospiraceae bacterium]